ncbi:MAG TPA: FliM/FliN family flagellar motor switch protein [Solirubrobacteraceae bacterium]|nr:FliM/FliN family flagellar motor switch protein [Solirubrobacteraceae bacterium]
MSTHQDITPREALIRLGDSTAEAIAQVLEMFVPGEVQRGEVTVLPSDQSPFANVDRGSIASSVSYVNGVTGANVFVLTPAGARGLAAAMGAPAPEAEGPDLSELELSAIAEAANQTMSAAASAIGVVLGQEIQISSPDTRVLDDPKSAPEIYGKAPHAMSTTFKIAGESCRLIQLVPAAFVVRMARAMDDRTAQQTAAEASVGGSSAGAGASGGETNPHGVALEEAIGGINLRVWAELGRSRMPLGSALGLPVGAVLDLDRPADAPVDLYVNGVRFARGQLLVTDDGEWAVSLEALESEGLRLLEQARSAQAAPRADVEAGPEPVDLPPDQPIEIETPAAEVGTPPAEAETTDVDASEADDVQAPETPDVQEEEVEGAVT